MVTYFVIYRGSNVDDAIPFAVCTNPKVIRNVAGLLLEDIPSTETSDTVTLAKRNGLSLALRKLQEELSE